jgi:hypothetical protein
MLDRNAPRAYLSMKAKERSEKGASPDGRSAARVIVNRDRGQVQTHPDGNATPFARRSSCQSQTTERSDNTTHILP